MNGAQDLGGMMGFGPINQEEDELPFHHEWERRAFALTLAAGFTGMWNIDKSRHARETIPPLDYLRFSYYKIWTVGLEKLLVDVGMLRQQELANDKLLEDPISVKQILAADNVEKALRTGGPSLRQITTKPVFTMGDTVVVKNDHPKGHTRVPRYVRGCSGRIVSCRGAHVFPDTNAHGNGENPNWLYSVCFSGYELWGEGAEPNSEICVDLWEGYLEYV